MSRATLGLIGWILFTCLASISGAVTAKTAQSFYASLDKPRWAPPAWLFGPAWGVLYLCMAVAAWSVWRDYGFDGARGALVLYVVHLIFNTSWSYFFFARRSGLWSTIDAVLLSMSVYATGIVFWQYNRGSGLLFVPYMMWVTFATALTVSVWRRNPQLLGIRG